MSSNDPPHRNFFGGSLIEDPRAALIVYFVVRGLSGTERKRTPKRRYLDIAALLHCFAQAPPNERDRTAPNHNQSPNQAASKPNVRSEQQQGLEGVMAAKGFFMYVAGTALVVCSTFGLLAPPSTSPSTSTRANAVRKRDAIHYKWGREQTIGMGVVHRLALYLSNLTEVEAAQALKKNYILVHTAARSCPSPSRSLPTPVAPLVFDKMCRLYIPPHQ